MMVYMSRCIEVMYPIVAIIFITCAFKALTDQMIARQSPS